MGQGLGNFLGDPKRLKRSLTALAGSSWTEAERPPGFLLRLAQHEDAAKKLCIWRQEAVQKGSNLRRPLWVIQGRHGERGCNDGIIGVDMQPVQVPVGDQPAAQVPLGVADQRSGHGPDLFEVQLEHGPPDLGDNFSGDLVPGLGEVTAQARVNPVQGGPEGDEDDGARHTPPVRIALACRDKDPDDAVSRRRVSGCGGLVLQQRRDARECRKLRHVSAERLEVEFGGAAIEDVPQGKMDRGPGGAHDNQPFGRASRASRGGLLEVQKGGK